MTLAFLNGRRDVWLEIQKHMNFSQQDIDRLEKLTAQEPTRSYGES